MKNMFMRSMALATLLPFISTSCGNHSSNPSNGSAAPVAALVMYQTKDLPPGLELRVSNGKQGAPAYDHANLAPAKKLSDADAQALLARTKPMKVDAQDQQTFALRPGSQPAPQTGQTIMVSFPPPPSRLLPPASNVAG